MSELDNPVIVEFPLRGEWVAPHTPAHKIPSHGTDFLGQRFAYDFIRIKDNKVYKNSNLRYFIFGIPTKNCYCWKEDIYAPVEGEVITIRDGLKECKRVHLGLDILRLFGRSIAYNYKAEKYGTDKVDLHEIVGNHIIIKHNGFYSFYAHLYPGSIKVELGQVVKEGEILGKVGHTGNSTSPHLHFHLMDSFDLTKAKGLPCAFREYEVYEEGTWRLVQNGIPKQDEVFRYRKVK